MTKILIADDDLEIGELLADAVRDEGWEPVVCQNGAEAYRKMCIRDSSGSDGLPGDLPFAV